MKKLLFILVLLTSVISVTAQSFQMGTPGSDGRIPQVHISTNRIGQMTTLTVDVAPQAQEVFVLIGTGSWQQRFPEFEPSSAYRAVLGVRPDPNPGNFLILRLPAQQPSLTFPVVGGLPILYVQALVSDPGATGGFAISPAISFVVANPMNRAIGQSPDPQHWYAASGVLDPRTGITYVLGGYEWPYWLSIQYDTVDSANPSNPGGFEVQNVGRCPAGFSSATAVWDTRNSVAYAIGGSNPLITDEILKFNPSTGQCTVFDHLPQPLWSPQRSAAVFDDVTGSIYIFGGLSASLVDTVILFNPNAPAGSRVQVLGVRIPQPITNTGAAARDPRTGTIYYLDNWGQRLLQFMSGGPQGGTFTEIPGARIPSPPEAADPNKIYRYTLVFHQDTNKLLLIGGNFGQRINAPPGTVVYNDKVYAFDPQNPTVGFHVLGTMTMPREFPIATIDPLTGLVLVVGGHAPVQNGIPPQLEVFDPLTARAYSARALPVPLSFTSAVRDPVSRKSFVVGGRSVSTPQVRSEIIVFDDNADLYSSVTTLADRLPFPRGNVGAAWDAINKRIVVFGGGDQLYYPISQIVEINPYANPGSQVTIAPETLQTPVVSPTVIADLSTNNIYIFGGQGILGNVNQILEWDPSRPVGTRLRTLATTLPGRGTFMAGAFFPEGAIYLFGGSFDSGMSNRILKFIPATGQMQTMTETLPDGLALMSAVYDSVHQTFLLFGGDRQSGPSDKIYRYTPGTAPQEVGTFSLGRMGSSAVFSPEKTTAYVFGGYNYMAGTYFTDIWAFSLGS